MTGRFVDATIKVMPRYIVDLSEEAARLIEAEILAGRQPSASAFLDELIREAQMHRANQEHFERLIDEGIESGPTVPVDDEFWAERRRKLDAALAKTSR